MEIWIYRVTALIGVTLAVLVLLGAFDPPPASLTETDVSGFAWFVLGASSLRGAFAIRREWPPLLDRLLRWIAVAGGLAIFGGALVYSFIIKDAQAAVACLIFGALWFWNLMQARSGNALPALGRAIFLMCCIVAGFCTTLLLITIAKVGSPLPGLQFGLMAAAFLAIGWVVRFVLARTS